MGEWQHESACDRPDHTRIRVLTRQRPRQPAGSFNTARAALPARGPRHPSTNPASSCWPEGEGHSGYSHPACLSAAAPCCSAASFPPAAMCASASCPRTRPCCRQRQSRTRRCTMSGSVSSRVLRKKRPVASDPVVMKIPHRAGRATPRHRSRARRHAMRAACAPAARVEAGRPSDADTAQAYPAAGHHRRPAEPARDRRLASVARGGATTRFRAPSSISPLRMPGSSRNRHAGGGRGS